MSLFEKLDLGIQIAVFAAAVIAVHYYGIQARFATKSHLSDVYRFVFGLMDDKRIRDARHLVYEMHPALGEGVPQAKMRDAKYWEGTPNHAEKEAADTVARSFDQLGLLVREGAIPLNIVAHFYASPAIRCWYSLQPFVGVERKKRSQNGHVWEWENLVLRILIPRIASGEGIWKGVSQHDGLEHYSNKIRNLPLIDQDIVYSPTDQTWEI